MQAIVSGCVFAAFAFWPKSVREPVSNLAFVIVIVATLTQAWITNHYVLTTGARFEPFLGDKLTVLAVALIGPTELWVALGCLAATTLLPVIQFFALPAIARHTVIGPEPWIALFYSVLGFVIYFHRRHQVTVEQQLASANTRALLSSEYVRKLIAVRDLANTPLQSIEFTMGRLAATCPGARIEIERIQRSLDRLRKLSTVLARYEPEAWIHEYAGFDPLEVLQDLEEGDEFDRLVLTGASLPTRPSANGEGSRLEEALRFTSFGLEHAPDGAFWLGEDGRLVYVNIAACRQLGYTRSELLGMHISEFVPLFTRAQWRDRLAHFRSSPPPPFRSVHRRKDGSVFDVEINLSSAEFGGHQYVLGFSRDISARSQSRG
jgi:PAS domain S-box-containing protein